MEGSKVKAKKSERFAFCKLCRARHNVDSTIKLRIPANTHSQKENGELEFKNNWGRTIPYAQPLLPAEDEAFSPYWNLVKQAAAGTDDLSTWAGDIMDYGYCLEMLFERERRTAFDRLGRHTQTFTSPMNDSSCKMTT